MLAVPARELRDAPMIGPVDVLPFSQKRRFDLHQLLAVDFN
jgi:hypothetical protein